MDLCTRFVANVPPDELQSFERMMFHIELVRAHRKSLDTICKMGEQQIGSRNAFLREANRAGRTPSLQVYNCVELFTKRPYS